MSVAGQTLISRTVPGMFGETNPVEEGWVVYYPGYINSTYGCQLYNLVRQYDDLKVREINVGIQPRLIAMMGDSTVDGYHYSGRLLPSRPWDKPTMLPLDPTAASVSTQVLHHTKFLNDALNTSFVWPALDYSANQTGTVNKGFNSCLINYYRNGDDKIGEHSDNEKQLSNPLVLYPVPGHGYRYIIPPASYGGDSVAILTLTSHPEAGIRKFFIREKANPENRITVDLRCGDLLIMMGNTQKFYTHGINASKTVPADPVTGDTGRISLSFRFIRPSK